MIWKSQPKMHKSQFSTIRFTIASGVVTLSRLACDMSIKRMHRFVAGMSHACRACRKQAERQHDWVDMKLSFDWWKSCFPATWPIYLAGNGEFMSAGLHACCNRTYEKHGLYVACFFQFLGHSWAVWCIRLLYTSSWCLGHNINWHSPLLIHFKWWVQYRAEASASKGWPTAGVIEHVWHVVA